MFEITVSTEFEHWYQALDAASAEQVASELNVLERLGPELDQVRASRLLLWFDGTSAAELPAVSPALLASTQQLEQLLRRRTEALHCLETPNFQARFLKLDAQRARQGHELIERLRASVRAAGLQLMLEKGGALVRDPARVWLSDGVQRALQELLELVGLRPEDVADTASGLRELSLRELAPPHRLLYGIDMPRRRILVILAEPRGRAYHGDAVRRAERRWRKYCRDLPPSVQP